MYSSVNKIREVMTKPRRLGLCLLIGFYVFARIVAIVLSAHHDFAWHMTYSEDRLVM